MRGAMAGVVAALSLLFLARTARAATIRQEWNISYATIAPDCVTKTVPTINGGYPGPSIYAVEGDRIIVKVCNDMYWPVAIHWHGMHMKGQQWMDGPAYGAQCPITTGECFTYNFTIDGQVGTYWYHGHVGLMRSSVYGALIVAPKNRSEEPFPEPTGEYHVLLNDWYHRYNGDILDGLHNKSWQFIGLPNSFLVNGRGLQWCKQYICPYENKKSWKCGKCDRKSVFCNPLTPFVVKPGGTYRFRIVNVGLWAQMNFAIEFHNITIIMADGSYLKPVEYESLDINPGQSFDVLVTMDRRPRNYWIAINGRYDNLFMDPPGLAVLKYEGSPVFNNTQPWWFPWPTGPDYYDTEFGPEQQKSYRSYYDVPGLATRKVDRYISLQWHQVNVSGYTRYAVNNQSFVSSETPLLAEMYMNNTEVLEKGELRPQFPHLNPDAGGLQPATEGTSILTVKKGEFVQIVLQNFLPPGGNHPWHLHGMDFYVVGTGVGVYNTSLEYKYKKTYNLKDPPFRNMVTVYDGTWTAIRFLADNPGIWNMHCHMEPHMELGMNLFLRVVGDPGDIPPPPEGLPKCGALLNATTLR